jgi:quercetin dioxygenase-like cupin family protein
MVAKPKMTAGITRAGEGEGGVAWNILGQTYKPMQHSEASFAFETLFPDGTFVPPHVHATQDEFIYMLDGKFELFLDGQTRFAGTGDLIRLPMGLPHGIFNKSGQPVRALFWVAPSRGLYELFTRIHNVSDPGEVVRIASEYEVEFLPPPG